MGSLLGGSHTLGHFDEASRNNVPASLDGFGEAFDMRGTTPQDRANIHGAGFKRQDIMNQALNTNESSLANAIYKLSYLMGLPQTIDSNITRGDIQDIKNDVGGFPREIIGITALSDLLKASGRMPNSSFTFNQNQNGIPMLQFNHRF
jgi:hypothetical protein